MTVSLLLNWVRLAYSNQLTQNHTSSTTKFCKLVKPILCRIFITNSNVSLINYPNLQNKFQTTYITVKPNQILSKVASKIKNKICTRFLRAFSEIKAKNDNVENSPSSISIIHENYRLTLPPTSTNLKQLLFNARRKLTCNLAYSQKIPKIKIQVVINNYTNSSDNGNKRSNK